MSEQPQRIGTTIAKVLALAEEQGFSERNTLLAVHKVCETILKWYGEGDREAAADEAAGH